MKSWSQRVTKASVSHGEVENSLTVTFVPRKTSLSLCFKNSLKCFIAILSTNCK